MSTEKGLTSSVIASSSMMHPGRAVDCWLTMLKTSPTYFCLKRVRGMVLLTQFCAFQWHSPLGRCNITKQMLTTALNIHWLQSTKNIGNIPSFIKSHVIFHGWKVTKTCISQLESLTFSNLLSFPQAALWSQLFLRMDNAHTQFVAML